MACTIRGMKERPAPILDQMPESLPPRAPAKPVTSRVFASIGNFSVRFRWVIVVGWVLITIVSVKAFPGLSDVAKDSQSSFLPASSPSVQAEDLAQPFQDSQHGVATLIAGSRERRAHRVGHPGDHHHRDADQGALRGASHPGFRALAGQARGAGAGGHRPCRPSAPAATRYHWSPQIRATFPSDASGLQVHLTGDDPRIRRPAESIEELAG